MFADRLSLARIQLSWNWQRVQWVAALGGVVGLFAVSFALPGGNDLFWFYLPFAQGCLTCGYVPYYAAWVLWPLSFLPPGVEWPFYVLASTLAWLGLSRVMQVNPLVILLAFPMIGELWLGQIDWVIAAGVVLALLSKNPYLRGVGIALAAVKPQVTWLTILALLWREPDWKKVLVAPIALGLGSLVAFGPIWPLAWLRSTAGLPIHTWRIRRGHARRQDQPIALAHQLDPARQRVVGHALRDHLGVRQLRIRRHFEIVLAQDLGCLTLRTQVPV